MGYAILTQPLLTEEMRQYRQCKIEQVSYCVTEPIFQFFRALGRKLMIFAALLVISALGWQWLTEVALMTSIVAIVKKIFLFWVSNLKIAVLSSAQFIIINNSIMSYFLCQEANLPFTLSVKLSVDRFWKRFEVLRFDCGFAT